MSKAKGTHCSTNTAPVGDTRHPPDRAVSTSGPTQSHHGAGPEPALSSGRCTSTTSTSEDNGAAPVATARQGVLPSLSTSPPPSVKTTPSNPSNPHPSQQQSPVTAQGAATLGPAAKKRRRDDSVDSGANSIADLQAEHRLSDPSYYDRLGCAETSTQAQIAVEFRRLARTLHPDRDVSRAVPHSPAAWEHVREAYATLSDPVTRKVYDTWRHAGLLVSFQVYQRRCSSGPHLHFASSILSGTRSIKDSAPGLVDDTSHTQHVATTHKGWSPLQGGDPLNAFRQGGSFT
eukprot:m.86659 g.86659  ORF g.86659 m.86659 type:complete len:289 (+) comp9673_c0_seq2:183-1049(+)